MSEIGNEHRREVGRHLNNRVENSHLPFRRRERAMSRFRRMRSLQKVRFNSFVCTQSLQSPKEYREQGQVQITT
jgi:transposase-like protein